jgi:putative ABC transport system permease protein
MKVTGLLWRSQLRFFLRSPVSSVTVLVGVALGVASVVAVHQINLRVNESLASATPVHLAGITHLLERDPAQAGAQEAGAQEARVEEAGVEETRAEDYFALRAQWHAQRAPTSPAGAEHDQSLVDVSSLMPVVEGQIDLEGIRTLVFATDWLAASVLQQQPQLRSLSLVGRDAVIADAALALEVGTVLTIAGVHCTVVANVESGFGPALFTDIGTGQAILGHDPGLLSYVAVVRRDKLAWLRDALEQALPGSSAGIDLAGGWRVDGWRVRPVAAELPLVGFARSILFNLGALGSLTLVVAWFLIHQVAVVWHRQRRPLMERLHMVGVPRGALRRGFVASFMLAGVLATAIGLLLGPLLADLLSAVLAPGEGPELAGWAIGKGVLSGVGVSLLGAWMACREARWHPLLRWLVLFGLLSALLVGLLVEASGLVGAFAAVLALCLLGVLSVRPLLVKLRGGRFYRSGSLLSRIGIRQVIWHPAESSIAIGALALAVGASMGVGIMVDNFRGDFVRMLDQRLAHDTFVTAGGRSVEEPYLWLQRAAPQAQIQRYGRARYRLGAWSVVVGYSDFSMPEAARYGLDRALEDGEVLINERLARSLQLASGDVIGSVPPLRIAGVFPGFGEPGMRALVDNHTAARMGIAKVFDRMSVSNLEAATREHWVATFPWLRTQSRSKMRGQALEIFDRTFAITRVLTLLSLLVAAVGVYNALLALRLNQSRSERLLAALGVTNAERRRTVLWRAVMVGGAALLLALPLGLGMAWLLCEVVNPRAFGWSLNFSLAPLEIALPLGVALVVSVVTGLLPMPRSEQHMAEVEGV